MSSMVTEARDLGAGRRQVGHWVSLASSQPYLGRDRPGRNLAQGGKRWVPLEGWFTRFVTKHTSTHKLWT